MAAERYRVNVQLLADKHGIPNPLREEDMAIQDLEFARVGDSKKTIFGTNMNRGGRLFFQDKLEYGETGLVYGERTKRLAEDYFAELWLDQEDRAGKRQLLEAIRWGSYVKIHWKGGT